MIGPFPWDPFPPGTPDPKGPDPIHVVAFRAAVTAGDSYRSVRLAVRREGGTLRIGNRFVPEGRYREVSFVAFGHAANSMALATLHAIGDRLTQGFVAGPEPVLSDLPFRGVTLAPGFGGAPGADDAVRAAVEVGEGLREQDLLIVLLSPGALRGLVLPPAGMAPDEFGAWLETAGTRGATGREVGLLARVVGSGAVGGRLAGAVGRGDVTTLIVERGDGPTVLGGGPMRPVAPGERVEARALIARLGLAQDLPPSVREALAPGSSPAVPEGTGGRERPVIVASPSDGLRAAADSVYDKGWTSRLAFRTLDGRPEAAADRFLARADELIDSERPTSEGRTKGIGAFAMTTLEVPEGADEGPAFVAFLDRARRGLRRREMSVGIFRTAGALRGPELPAGAVVGAPTYVASGGSGSPGPTRAVPMRPGITDIGMLVVALHPRTAGADRADPSRS